MTSIAWRQLRQCSDVVNSIWEVERLLHMFHALLDYADFPTALAPAQDDGHLPRVPDVNRWFFAAVGSRQCKPVWKTYHTYINLSCGRVEKAFPVRGSWADEWCPETSPARQHEALAAPQGREASTYLGISQADAVSGLEAISFLKQAEDAFNARPEPRGPFRTDITGKVSASSQS